VAYGNNRHHVSVDEEQGHIRDVCAATGCVLLMVMEDVGCWIAGHGLQGSRPQMVS
jgi:hypothetical protein